MTRVHRRSERLNDDVEDLVVVAVVLDVLLEGRRGVAPAGSVLEVGCGCTLPDGAGTARAVSSGSGAPQASGDQPGGHRADRG